MREWALPQIDTALCNMCGACVQECPTQAVEMSDSGPVIVRPDDCTFCTACETVCIAGAIHCEFEIVWNETDMDASPVADIEKE